MANIPNSFLNSVASAQAAGAAAAIAASQAGSSGNVNGANVNDLFNGLLGMSWRGIHFPYVETEIELRHDLAPHKFVDRDGAHVEGTGRAPLQFTARIPFLNGLSRGKNEEWVNPLYPGEWREFFAAFADRSTGILQHPELGDIACKPEVIRVRWEAGVRSGVYVNASWIETDDPDLNLNLALASTSPTANMQQSASDLDAQQLEINPGIVPQPYRPAFTFTDLATAIRGAIDQVTIFQKEFFGRVDNFIFEAQSIEDALDRAVNASALNWPMYQAAELAKSSCYDLKATMLSKARAIAFYTVPKDSTLAQIATTIGVDVLDMMVLNQALVQAPVIPSGAVLRYYTN